MSLKKECWKTLGKPFCANVTKIIFPQTFRKLLVNFPNIFIFAILWTGYLCINSWIPCAAPTIKTQFQQVIVARKQNGLDLPIRLTRLKIPEVRMSENFGKMILCKCHKNNIPPNFQKTVGKFSQYFFPSIFAILWTCYF